MNTVFIPAAAVPDVGHISQADLGGLANDDHVQPEPEGELFHAAWQPRALALTLAAGATGTWNIDMSRRQRESLPTYSQRSYYDIWLTALEGLLQAHGLVTAHELATGQASTPAAPVARVLRRADVAAALAQGSATLRSVAHPAVFATGNRVRARPVGAGHHTRLPRYVWGKIGVIERVHGAHVWADSHAHGLGEQPQWLYTVRFAARDLFGPDAHAGHAVTLDAWEPYLEPIAASEQAVPLPPLLSVPPVSPVSPSLPLQPGSSATPTPPTAPPTAAP